MRRERVLTTTLAIIGQYSAEGLSTRRLGHAPGRAPMSLYRCVASKSALLDGVAKMVLGNPFVHGADDVWTTQLRAVVRDSGNLALERPQALRLLVTCHEPFRSHCGPWAPCALWRRAWSR
jgi:AcrR family transcriptional regulator